MGDRDDDSSDANRLAPAETPGGQPVEKVEDRPNVSTVKPEDYPHPASPDESG